nr:beta-galactosidase trimerization domain-containing protein [Paenibacillus humicola]
MEQFKNWLREKYGSLKQVGGAWQMYSLQSWNDVHPPYRPGPYAHSLDWLKFKKDNFYELMQWRIDTIRANDPDSLIMAHGEAAALNNYRLGGSDEWRAAAKVQVYGYTFAHERHGTQLWKQMHAADLVRAGSEGKPYWHNEIQGGPVWFNPFSHTTIKGSTRDNGRFPTDEDVRFWSLASIAGGAKGVLNPRWRPLLDGPLFGAYGYYNMDGSPNSRSRMASALAKWINHPDRKAFCESVSARGQIGLLVTQEALAFKYLLGLGVDSDVYDEAISGAYRGFFDNNIQADFVSMDQIDRYDLLFYPFPVLMEREDARKLTEWVEKGGKLICQGCPAYFGDTGRVGTLQPDFGLNVLFGVKQHEAEFMPDLDDIRFHYAGKEVRGGLFMQSYISEGAEVKGTYPDGTAAVAEYAYGKGKTLLIGTFPSAGYYHHADENSRSFFAGVLAWGGKKPEVAITGDGVYTRLFEKPGGGIFLWILNPGKAAIDANLSLSEELGSFRLGRVLWGQCRNNMNRNCIRVKVPPKDGILLELEISRYQASHIRTYG